MDHHTLTVDEAIAESNVGEETTQPCHKDWPALHNHIQGGPYF